MHDKFVAGTSHIITSTAIIIVTMTNFSIIKIINCSSDITCWRWMWCCCCCADLSMTIAIAVEVGLTEEVEVEEGKGIEKEQSERRQDGGDGGRV